MQSLTFSKVIIRGADIPLKRPIVSHLGVFKTWPYLCLDVFTKEGIIGKSYISPYLKDYLPDTTIIMISHRQEITRHCDKVINLDD